MLRFIAATAAVSSFPSYFSFIPLLLVIISLRPFAAAVVVVGKTILKSLARVSATEST